MRYSWAAQVPHHPIRRTRVSRHAGPICQELTFRFGLPPSYPLLLLQGLRLLLIQLPPQK
jgi:hypothetical protein